MQTRSEGEKGEWKRLQGSLTCHIRRKNGAAPDAGETAKIGQGQRSRYEEKGEKHLSMHTHQASFSDHWSAATGDKE